MWKVLSEELGMEEREDTVIHGAQQERQRWVVGGQALMGEGRRDTGTQPQAAGVSVGHG